MFLSGARCRSRTHTVSQSALWGARTVEWSNLATGHSALGCQNLVRFALANLSFSHWATGVCYAGPYGATPAMSQTIRHSSSVTGCTLNRVFFTSAISDRRGSALHMASVTGVSTVRTALISTQSQRVSSCGAVGMPFRDDLNDADDRLFRLRVIERTPDRRPSSRA